MRDGGPVRAAVVAETRPLGPAPLTEGQAVTVLVAVGLDLVRRQHAGLGAGRLHPADVLVDAEGRPRLAPRPPSRQLSDDDERQALLRLAWSLAPPASALRAAVVTWSRGTDRSLADLVPALLEVAEPEPLAARTPAALPRPRTVSPGRPARHAARRRWWGRGRRTRLR